MDLIYLNPQVSINGYDNAIKITANTAITARLRLSPNFLFYLTIFRNYADPTVTEPNHWLMYFKRSFVRRHDGAFKVS
jgi:hypothetical protein